MNNNNIKALFFSILSVLLIGFGITGGTYAYFQWSLGYVSGTGVNVIIEHDGITMRIEPEETNFVGLYPTKVDDSSDCARIGYGDALVTIVNKTGTLAIPSFRLKVRVTKGGSDALTADALSHINYAVVPITTTLNENKIPVKGDTGYYHCASTPYVEDDRDEGGFFYNGTYLNSSFTFESVSTEGGWSHVPQIDDTSSSGFKVASEYLPRQYFVSEEAEYTGNSVGSIKGITFKAPQYSTTYQYYRVYVWIDEEYESVTIGDVITDPLQNAKIEITWSEESVVQQVNAVNEVGPLPNSVPLSNNGVELAAGLYDENGNFTSWDDLILAESISADAETLYDSSVGLTGDLVIPEGIVYIGIGALGNSNIQKVVVPSTVTSIGDSAFAISTLSEVEFASNSQLSWIDMQVFLNSAITRIEIPSSVTHIGFDAFTGCTNLETIIFRGTVAQWNAIDLVENWQGDAPATYVQCSDGNVPL